LLTLALVGTCARSADYVPAQPVPQPAELESSGAVIGDILIDPQNIFDLNDPREDKGVFRLANGLHVKTRDNVIRQQLLFRSGDRFSQRALEESERILRSARYLYDASVKPVAYHNGRVDIAVTTRDVWTLNPGISFGRHGGTNTFGFELEELNILGTGTSISAAHKSGVDRDSDILEYKDSHLGGSWLSLSAKYANNSDGSTRGLSLERPFYALDTPHAAGFAGLDDDRIESLYDRGEVVDKFQDRSRTATVYGGWSRGLVDGWTKRWTYGATYDDEQFAPEPGWAGPSLVPLDRRFVYPWIGFDLIQNNFEKLQNRDQIGRTEDFYLGTRISAKLGWAAPAFGSDRNALIFSAAAGYGIGASERSTLLFSSSLSGRMEDGDLRNTVLNGAVRYYLQQSQRRLLFATFDASAGRNLDLDNQILLGGDNGLRGYPLRYQAGDARALLTVEQRYFTDWYPFRLFRIGGAAFFDMGRTWGDTAAGAPSLGMLRDVGVGLRIGNSRSGLGNIIHVDVAFPLDGDASISNVQFLVETKQRF
jgi:outer membrane protein assembly factor BamA